jgi:hypothetical protein
VRDDARDDVRVTFDDEVKSPVAVHAHLPHIAGFIVLFCPKPGMMKVFDQEQQLLVESPLNRFGRLAVVANEMFGSEKASSGRAFGFFVPSPAASLCSEEVNSS